MMIERAFLGGLWLLAIFWALAPESMVAGDPFFRGVQYAAWAFIAWRLIRYLRWRVAP